MVSHSFCLFSALCTAVPACFLFFPEALACFSRLSASNLVKG